MTSVTEALDAELQRLPADAQRSPLAAVAHRLAEVLDDPFQPASAKASCAKTLTDTLDRLRALAPSEKQEDKVDELRTRRARRRAAPAV